MTYSFQLRDLSSFTDEQVAEFWKQTRELNAAGKKAEARQLWESLPIATKKPASLGG